MRLHSYIDLIINSLELSFFFLSIIISSLFICVFSFISSFIYLLIYSSINSFIYQFLNINSSWNSEISQIYPQFSLQSINRLERLFCSEIKWDLYISSSAYAKYYFALRSLTEKKDFRRFDKCCNI